MSSGNEPRSFDGIICIGGSDWWYHNRGHFDFQIMRRIAKHWPVLYVNSLGVRVPSLRQKGLFAERMWRKMKSLSRGVTNPENKFWVYSPATIPGEKGQKLFGWALAPQIRLAALRAGIRRPLLWMHCPAGAPLMTSLPSAGVVMQRTDRFEAFPEADPVLLSRQIKDIKNGAELVFYAAPHLENEEKAEVERTALVTHGVELKAFAAAGSAVDDDPEDMTGLGRPRIGFIGGIDAHTFDPDLFRSVVARCPDLQFVMIGSCSLPDGWCPYDNVTFLGRKPYDGVARYMAAMDVLIMPWNKSEWIKACNPIKLKEYLAVGRPVVTTDFPALKGWRDLVRVADEPAAFAAAIRESLWSGVDAAYARSRLTSETWDAKAGRVMCEIEDLGLKFKARGNLLRSAETPDAVRSASAVARLV